MFPYKRRRGEELRRRERQDMKKTSAIVFALAAFAGTAMAQFNVTTGTSPTYASNGLFNSAANGSLSFTYSGPAFPIASYTINGRLTRAGTSTTQPTEARIGLDIPGGGQSQASGQLFSGSWPLSGVVQGSNLNRRAIGGTGSQVGNGNTMQILSSPAMMQPGTGAFRFFETVDDGGEVQIDARWNLLNLTVNPVVAPSGTNVTNLGTIGLNGAQITGTTNALNPVQWYRFVLPNNATFNSGRWFDITTRANGAAFDTSVALFRGSDGALLSIDDEDGTGSFSQLSFGSPSITPFTGASAGNRGSGAIYTGSASAVGGHGRDSALDAGEYYVAVGHYTSAFNAAGTAVTASEGFGTSAPTAFGSFTLNLTTNIPAPGALALVGMGGLVAARRRRA